MNTIYRNRLALTIALCAFCCIHNAFAFYNPTQGRWLNRDPAGEITGLNLSAFVENSPVSFSDRLGLAVNDPPPVFGGCRPCCCCVNGLSIQNLVGVHDERLPGHFGKWFGHQFDVVASLGYQRHAIGGSCSMVWREKISRDANPPAVANQWDDIFTLAPNSVQKRQWDRRREPCPGSEMVTVHDPPSMQVPLQGPQDIVRVLEFEITAYSSTFCPCAFKSLTVRAIQVLTFVGGQGVALLSPFVILQ